MVKIHNYRKSYGSVDILDITSLKIGNGIYWVKGLNGAGKSTLLRSIAGIIDFDGDILLQENISLKKHPIRYRQIVNFGEAEPVFPDYLTGYDLIELFAKAKKASKEQIDFYVSSLSISHFLNEAVGSYSSGMLKKLSIVLAFLGSSRVIILDEPLTTLDTDSIEIIYGWIIKAHLEHNTTFLISSHQELLDTVYTGIINVANRTAITENDTLKKPI